MAIIQLIRYISTNALRAIWLLLLVALAWSLTTGKGGNPLHPFNVVLIGVDVIGACAISFAARSSRILAGTCGIISAVITAYQIWSVMVMVFCFAGNAKFGSWIGPFESEGAWAHVIWFFPVL